MDDDVIGYYGVINHKDPNSNLLVGEISKDECTIRGAANLLPVFKEESRHYAALLREQQEGMTDGLHRNPFHERDVHLTGLVARVRFGTFVYDTSGDATPGLIASTAYILSQIYEVKGFVLEIGEDRYDLLPIHGDDPEAIRAEVEAILRRLAES